MDDEDNIDMEELLRQVEALHEPSEHFMNRIGITQGFKKDEATGQAATTANSDKEQRKAEAKNETIHENEQERRVGSGVGVDAAGQRANAADSKHKAPFFHTQSKSFLEKIKDRKARLRKCKAEFFKRKAHLHTQSHAFF